MNSIEEIVKALTLEEKTALSSGLDTWHSKSVDRLGIRSLLMHDGPHGLRKQQDTTDSLGLNESVPATCFPTAVTLACSFDRELLGKVGEAIGKEALSQETDIVLGPGINIKRSPLCGRNFEYFSEDPLLAGELAAAYINGVQSQGVGTSLKHFAANNQEFCRVLNNSQVDERTLREIYLKPFEIAIRKAQPWTVMTSYNKLNGEYTVQHRQLMTDILRDEWGFEGLVVSDWSAVDDRVKAVWAGTDLEMPSSGRNRDEQLLKAARAGKIDMASVDRSVSNLLKLIEKCDQKKEKPGKEIYQENHQLARKVLGESAVLLKNYGEALPLKREQSVLVVGEMGEQPHYQGSGSSRVNPTCLVNITEAVVNRGLAWEFLPGYSIASLDDASLLREEACRAAKNKDAVVIIAGLTEDDEAEGYDRRHLELTANQNALIEALAAVNPNVIVVLQGGGVMLLPWIDKVKAVLFVGLAGQAFGDGTLDLLLGEVNPSGKLAESWPLSLADVPSQPSFGQRYNSPYPESIFVGYRYYASVGKEVRFPFGFGLSYTKFELSELKLASPVVETDESLKVTVKVRNIGKVVGKTVVQLYTRAPKSWLFKVDRELKAFEKVELEPGKEKVLEFDLTMQELAFWNPISHKWQVEGGEYELLVGLDSLDLPLSANFTVKTSENEEAVPDFRDLTPQYYQLPLYPEGFSIEQFEKLPGSVAVPEPKRTTGNFDLNSTLWEARNTLQGRLVAKQALKGAAVLIENSTENTGNARRTIEASTIDAPLRSFILGGVSLETIEGIRDILNLRLLRGLWKVWKGSRE